MNCASESDIIIGYQLIDVSYNENTLSWLSPQLPPIYAWVWDAENFFFIWCCIVYVLATIVSEGRSDDKYANELNIGNLRLAEMSTCRCTHSFRICCRLCETDSTKQTSAVLSKKTCCGTLHQHIFNISFEKYHDIWWTLCGSSSVWVWVITLIRNFVVIW